MRAAGVFTHQTNASSLSRSGAGFTLLSRPETRQRVGAIEATAGLQTPV
jgi:hypothetical protein